MIPLGLRANPLPLLFKPFGPAVRMVRCMKDLDNIPANREYGGKSGWFWSHRKSPNHPHEGGHDESRTEADAHIQPQMGFFDAEPQIKATLSSSTTPAVAAAANAAWLRRERL